LIAAGRSGGRCGGSRSMKCTSQIRR
jgi:hypothetical protein